MERIRYQVILLLNDRCFKHSPLFGPQNKTNTSVRTYDPRGHSYSV